MATLTLSGFEDTALVEVCCTVACWTFSVLYLGDDLFDRFMFREVRLAFAGFEADLLDRFMLYKARLAFAGFDATPLVEDCCTVARVTSNPASAASLRLSRMQNRGLCSTMPDKRIWFMRDSRAFNSFMSCILH